MFPCKLIYLVLTFDPTGKWSIVPHVVFYVDSLDGFSHPGLNMSVMCFWKDADTVRRVRTDYSNDTINNTLRLKTGFLADL